MRASIRVHQNQQNSRKALQSNQRLNIRQNIAEDYQKPETSHMFMNRSNNDQFVDQIIQFNSPTLNKINPQSKIRKQLNIVVFLIVIIAQVGYTFYPAVTFSRLNGQYEFFIMGFSLPVFYLIVSGYLLRDFGRFLPLYSLLDPLMVLTLSLIGVYIIPYVLMGMKSVPQILELVGFGVCNLAMVGNFRVMILEMRWESVMVVIYKLSKMLGCLFYLAFGAYYRIENISYSVNTSTDIDSKVQYIVLLYVLSGFSLQLMMVNKISDFDQSNLLQTNYQIIDNEQQAQQLYCSNCNNNSNNVNNNINNNNINNNNQNINHNINQNNQQQIYNIYSPQQQSPQHIQQSINNMNKSIPKSPHYPSFNIHQQPTIHHHNNSQLKVDHNLNQIRKFQRKSIRQSIDLK